MAWTVDSAFEEFHQIINLPGDHRTIANARRDWVVNRLKGKLDILDSFAMGSIPRYTALEGHADLDIILALHYSKHIKDRLPSTVLQNLKTALGSISTSVRRNGQAVTVKFQSWPDIDIVPAARVADDGKVTGYSIPDMNREVWLSSNPPKHSADVNAKASLAGSKFRQVIKFAKDWNRRQDASIQSYHLEVIALKTATDWREYDWSVLQWFKTAETQLTFCLHDGRNVADYLSTSQIDRVRAQLQAAQATASNAWYEATPARNDQAKAIRLWKSIFGQRFPSYGN